MWRWAQRDLKGSLPRQQQQGFNKVVPRPDVQVENGSSGSPVGNRSQQSKTRGQKADEEALSVLPERTDWAAGSEKEISSDPRAPVNVKEANTG